MEEHTHPAFMVCLFPKDLAKTSMKLPYSFVRECAEHLPQKVSLIIHRNGYQYNALFHKDRNELNNLALFYNDFRTDAGFHALFYYNGAGIFTVFILDNTGMEIDYPESNRINLAPAYAEDNINGIGKKFIVYTVERHRELAEIEIPPVFLDRFRHMIKKKNYLTLKNGDKFQFKFCYTKKMFGGLQVILKHKYWKIGDTLLFELFDKTEFSVTILSRKGVEKTIPPQASITGNVITTEEADDFRRSFEATLISSNFDMNSHGVYIPPWITLQNHAWKSVKHVYLKMKRRKWKVGIVFVSGKPRFSKGWDKFVKENKFLLNDKLRFVMREEDHVLSFVVQRL